MEHSSIQAPSEEGQWGVLLGEGDGEGGRACGGEEGGVGIFDN